MRLGSILEYICKHLYIMIAMKTTLAKLVIRYLAFQMVYAMPVPTALPIPDDKIGKTRHLVEGGRHPSKETEVGQQGGINDLHIEAKEMYSLQINHQTPSTEMWVSRGHEYVKYPGYGLAVPKEDWVTFDSTHGLDFCEDHCREHHCEIYAFSTDNMCAILDSSLGVQPWLMVNESWDLYIPKGK